MKEKKKERGKEGDEGGERGDKGGWRGEVEKEGEGEWERGNGGGGAVAAGGPSDVADFVPAPSVNHADNEAERLVYEVI